MQFISTDVSEETWEIPETYMRPSINLPGDVSEICKSALFCLYQTPRRCTWDASMPSGNAFSTSIIFLQSSLRRQLSITSFIHMSAVVVTWKSRIPLLTGFKIIKFKIETFNIFKCSTKEVVNQFFCTAVHRQVISYRCISRNLSGHGVFLQIGQFDEHFMKNTRKKCQTGENLGVFFLEKLKNCILDKKFNP